MKTLVLLSALVLAPFTSAVLKDRTLVAALMGADAIVAWAGDDFRLDGGLGQE